MTVPITFSTSEDTPFICGYVMYSDAFGDIHGEPVLPAHLLRGSLQTEPAGSQAWNDFNYRGGVTAAFADASAA